MEYLSNRAASANGGGHCCIFRSRPGVDAVLLVNFCGRGGATADSDLDFAVLVSPILPV
jgi:predicted nucleotidyltransferase